jgi:DNA-directed RNA polymerase specialized sigma24 family protein
LRSIAAKLLHRESPGHTLQPTALVTESFLKLHRIRAPIASEAHFFHLSARAMKQVLVEHARTRGSWIKVTAESIIELLPAVDQGRVQPELALSVKAVLSELQAMDPKAAEALWLRCVEGWTIEETSLRQQRDQWRVRADCDFALEWLAAKLTRQSPFSSTQIDSVHSSTRAGRCAGSA